MFSLYEGEVFPIKLQERIIPAGLEPALFRFRRPVPYPIRRWDHKYIILDILIKSICYLDACKKPNNDSIQTTPHAKDNQSKFMNEKNKAEKPKIQTQTLHSTANLIITTSIS